MQHWKDASKHSQRKPTTDQEKLERIKVVDKVYKEIIDILSRPIRNHIANSLRLDFKMLIL